MTVTTAETLSLDGVVLNTLAKNITSLTGRLKVPPMRTENITVPGRNGTLRTARKLYSEGEIALPMWVRGVDDDGNIPDSAREQFYANVDALTNLFRPGSGKLMELIHTLPDGSRRRALVECTEALDFTMTGRELGKFAVALRIPSVFWEDADAITVDLPIGTTGPVVQFAGTTAPIEDAVYTVYGPASVPKIEAYYNGGPMENPNWVQYQENLALGQSLTINSATWNLTLNGGPILDYTKLSQAGTARLLTLVPGPGGAPPQLKVTAGGTTADSKLRVVARRKFLVG